MSVLSGLPGSGKSTRARELEASGAVRIGVEELIGTGLDRGTAVQRAKETLREALENGRQSRVRVVPHVRYSSCVSSQV